MFYVNFFSRKVEVSNLCENKTIIMQREHFPPLYNFASFWPPMLLCFFVSEQNVDKFFRRVEYAKSFYNFVGIIWFW